MSTTVNTPFVFSAKQIACIDADRLATNENGSALNGQQFADIPSYLNYLLGYGVMLRACESYASIYNLPVPDDLVEGDSGYVAPVE